MKRYVDEDGRDQVIELMNRAIQWNICELGFVETVRAVEIASGDSATRFKGEWREFNVIRVDHTLSLHAAKLASDHSLRALDAYHVAAASLLPRDDLTVLTWDGRMGRACRDLGLAVFPE